MRLWNRQEEPIGGWTYVFKDESGIDYTVRSATFNQLISDVAKSMQQNGVKQPENLPVFIEDQICTRQPAGRCYYENKTGDNISKLIHVFARTGDAALKTIGINANLEVKARSCLGCSQRRSNLNT